MFMLLSLHMQGHVADGTAMKMNEIYVPLCQATIAVGVCNRAQSRSIVEWSVIDWGGQPENHAKYIGNDDSQLPTVVRILHELRFSLTSEHVIGMLKFCAVFDVPRCSEIISCLENRNRWNRKNKLSAEGISIKAFIT
ncbi:hypothetical protein OUZ56_006913 [Daphnia magna]|uniref:Uncharacterized protein n=1 Tax=Daphnia magna TaxID=35525 RepID=A0ABQ9YX18_9CRUS|nr:hypothetical protein OUZ56_006913 [Daphnia magna]